VYIELDNSGAIYYHRVMWFTFSQNNSGGRFVTDKSKGLGEVVWIEAYSMDRVLELASDIGIYFNGVEEERDCDCCGDRWDLPNSYEGAIESDLCYPAYLEGKGYIHHLSGLITHVSGTIREPVPHVGS
jgi:hypothetical protein